MCLVSCSNLIYKNKSKRLSEIYFYLIHYIHIKYILNIKLQINYLISDIEDNISLIDNVKYLFVISSLLLYFISLPIPELFNAYKLKHIMKLMFEYYNNFDMN